MRNTPRIRRLSRRRISLAGDLHPEELRRGCAEEDRQLAKAVNFGLLYGQYAKGLVRYAAAAYGVQLPEDRAIEIRKAFFRTYPHLRQWHGRSHQEAKRDAREVRTRLGRRRLIPGDASEWNRFTALVNTRCKAVPPTG